MDLECRAQVGEHRAEAVAQVADEVLQRRIGVALVVGVQGQHAVLERQQQAQAQAQHRERCGRNGDQRFEATPDQAHDHVGAIDRGGGNVVDLALQLHVVQQVTQVEHGRHALDRVVARQAQVGAVEVCGQVGLGGLQKTPHAHPGLHTDAALK